MESGPPTSDEQGSAGGGPRGPIAWFSRNAVAANILMIALLVGGYLSLQTIKQEVFPQFDLDVVLISVPYPGASPAEVEQGVVLAVEEAVRGVDGIKEITSTAQEGSGVVSVELVTGADSDRALNDIKAAVDRITSFPENVEKHNVFKASTRQEVLSVAIYGDASERSLRTLAETTRDRLLRDERVTEVELFGVRPLEISIEVSQEDLRRYGLTIPEIAARVEAASVEVPGGGVKTPGGEVLLRTAERRDTGAEFAEVILVSRPDGTVLRLGDIAEVEDGFAETDQAATYNGQPAAMVKVFRTGEQTPIEISNAVHQYIDDHEHELPTGVDMAAWLDTSEVYEQRIDLLLRNAYIGLALVMLILGMFLQIRLAFWVTLGIPISFLGSLLFLPGTGVSINMISLFAFILVLGMVVDDAIVVGEAVYRRRQQGMGRVAAAVSGAREVAAPVTFAIATTMIAYAPMLFVPGPAGKFFRVIPIVVVAVLLLSLVESLLILPAHLAHSKPGGKAGLFGRIGAVQQRFSRRLERVVDRIYVPSVTWAVRHRYFTIAAALAFAIATVGIFAGGRLKSSFLPKVDHDVVFAEAKMPYGTDVAETAKLRDHLVESARGILDERGGVENLSRGLFAQVGAIGFGRGGDLRGGTGQTGSHLTEVAVYTVSSDERPFTAKEFANAWRRRIEDHPGIESISFTYSTGPSAGAPLAVELRHPDMETLERAAEDLASQLEQYTGAYDIDDGFTRGKQQLDFTLTPEARSLGLTEIDLARQVRGAFFGAEAVRQQRGREEVRVYVRLPDEERDSEYNVERFMVRTPNGGELPLHEAAEVERGRSYTSIRRINNRRAVEVTADVDMAVGNANDIMKRVVADVLPGLVNEYPGLDWRLAGEQEEQKEVFASLGKGSSVALLAMFALLAIAFSSYAHALVIMLAIPFGAVGAIWGHVIMNQLAALIPALGNGYLFSLMSIFGVVALAGVVVNDSLILVVAINRFRREGMPLVDAVVAGGARRFRPILLTSLTTFFGLAPMILETSVQARFLIPMAISLGFGVMFATFITLVMIPSAYTIIEDVRRAAARARRWLRGPRA